MYMTVAYYIAGSIWRDLTNKSSGATVTNWQLPRNLWVGPIKPWGQDKSVLPMFFQLLCFKTLLGIFGDLRVKYCIRSLHILDPGVNKHYCNRVFKIMFHSSTTFCVLYEKCPLGSKCWNHLSWFWRNFETLETWWTGAKLPRVRRRCSNTKRIQNDPLPLQFLLNW